MSLDQTSILSLGSLVIAAVAAGIASWQALDARGAREDARAASAEADRHRIAALQAASDAASGVKRSASALEEANELTRTQLPLSPWKLERAGGSKYAVVYTGHMPVQEVTYQDIAGGSDITPYEALPKTVHPGESLYFDYTKTMESAPNVTLWLTYRNLGEDRTREWRASLG